MNSRSAKPPKIVPGNVKFKVSFSLEEKKM